ncbi:dinitrogenase iron-molybdenum cofactor biosynthesis protein [Candidatus Thorarchaeota archaeon]|nr:MAG: dinitrogenase iron-molybdenum cofactor biosynthesis protein [Candidatus Thorarchaeota archaeon]
MARICVTSSGPTLESTVDPRFGRCAYFIVADTETLAFDAISNEAAMASGGAGVRAAQTVAAQNVEAVLTGSVGPNAFPALQDSGIKILAGISGTVKSAIESYKGGSLEELATPGPANVGKGQGGPGRGLGMGRGAGMGMGMGRGGGMGSGRGGGRGRHRGGRT